MKTFAHPFADEAHKLLLGSVPSPNYAASQRFLTTAVDGITVEAWVRAGAYRSEAMQPLVSVWQPLSSFDSFSAFDAEGTDGLPARGFFGAVFDGRYVYGCPSRTEQPFTAAHGGVLRYDTHGEFKNAASYEAYDAGFTDGLHTRGFYGGAFDGRYVYFNPRDDGASKHSRFLRFDTTGDFKSPACWEAFDAGHAHSFQGCAFDGRYLYSCPGYTVVDGEEVESGMLMRFDTEADFKSAASYQVFDTAQLGGKVINFDGACFDGRHIYFAPLSHGVALRYDTESEFADRNSWEIFDAGASHGMGANVGAVFAGHHIYYCSYANSTMVRYDTRGDFAHVDSWSAHQAADTDGLDSGGFDGGFFDGRYVYFIPFTRYVPAGAGASKFHGNYLRYDTAGSFDDASSWRAHDASYVDGLHTTAFNGGATDGRFLYAAPWRGDRDEGRGHGRILRYDILGDNGAFSLRYADCGHNGGLCAAVPGPSFLVNTVGGPVSASAHARLTSGWHYLAGVYDGRSIRLVIDGETTAQRQASGALQRTDVDITLGHIAGGAARFDGHIEGVGVSDVARSDEWLQSTYEKLREAVE